ncbi:GreA/GreB family elongation factor [Chitinophaga sp. Cy-1792]|nr:GreA/GreB family elongation factor [Chitinophaga sp. Cy-1792]
MAAQEMIGFKNSLKLLGQQIIENRIAAAQAAIDNAQEAANNESKSSAGDKYETGRAMGHLEKDMYTRQQAENLKELAQLKTVKADMHYTTARTGALIVCEAQYFFIAAGLGKQQVDDRQVFFLSPLSPLARVLLNKKAGDTFIFNKQEMVIIEIY